VISLAKSFDGTPSRDWLKAGASAANGRLISEIFVPDRIMASEESKQG
jgi:hypothetical protein